MVAPENEKLTDILNIRPGIQTLGTVACNQTFT